MTRSSVASGTAPAADCGCAPAIPAGIDAVVFDFDGTLADTAARNERALRATLAAHGVELDTAWYRRHLGLPIHELLARYPATRSLPHEKIIHSSRVRLLSATDTLTPNRCVLALLHAARRSGLPCAVASGAARILLDPGITALGLTHEMTAIVARDDVEQGKPAPDLYLAAAERLGIPPARCLAVDDAPDGLTAARVAGMPVVPVRDGHLTPTGTSLAPGRARQQGT